MTSTQIFQNQPHDPSWSNAARSPAFVTIQSQPGHTFDLALQGEIPTVRRTRKHGEDDDDDTGDGRSTELTPLIVASSANLATGERAAASTAGGLSAAHGSQSTLGASLLGAPGSSSHTPQGNGVAGGSAGGGGSNPFLMHSHAHGHGHAQQSLSGPPGPQQHSSVSGTGSIPGSDGVVVIASGGSLIGGSATARGVGHARGDRGPNAGSTEREPLLS